MIRTLILPDIISDLHLFIFKFLFFIEVQIYNVVPISTAKLYIYNCYMLYIYITQLYIYRHSFFIYNFVYFWLCWVFIAVWAFSLVAKSKLCSLRAVHGLFTVVTTLVTEQGLQGVQASVAWHLGSVAVAPRLQSTGSIVVVHWLTCLQHVVSS